VRLARDRSYNQQKAAHANSGSISERALSRPPMRSGLSPASLYYSEFSPNETQARSQFAIDTRNIPELGISEFYARQASILLGNNAWPLLACSSRALPFPSWGLSEKHPSRTSEEKKT
jgi:hypothetical protein